MLVRENFFVGLNYFAEEVRRKFLERFSDFFIFEVGNADISFENFRVMSLHSRFAVRILLI